MSEVTAESLMDAAATTDRGRVAVQVEGYPQGFVFPNYGVLGAEVAAAAGDQQPAAPSVEVALLRAKVAELERQLAAIRRLVRGVLDSAADYADPRTPLTPIPNGHAVDFSREGF